MNSTRQQRKTFVKNAKKQWKIGAITKEEYKAIRKNISDMGKEQHADLTRQILENNGVTTLDTKTIDILETELEDDFTPEDL